MPQVYVTGELTLCKNPEEQKKFYEAIAAVCEETGFSTYLPHKHTDPIDHPDVTPREVYEKDHDIVANAEYLIAYAGQPSLGVGIELEIANKNDTRIIMMLHKDDKVSRMALGCPGVDTLIAYESEEDALEQVQKALSR